MVSAFVHGAAVPFERAVFDAARLLARARLPVISGLDLDVAAIRLAVRLAEKTGGVVDHLASAETLKLTETLRTGGGLLAAPEEIRRLADFALCAGAAQFTGCPVERIEADDLPALRAAAGGRAHRSRNPSIDRIAEALRGARFGAVVWRSQDLDGPQTEMAMGLVKDINAVTRCTALPLFTNEAALGADLVSTWLTGFPARTSLARGFADHDVWTHAAGRLLASGEADLALWVSDQPPGKAFASNAIVVGPVRTAARISFRVPPLAAGTVYSGATGTFVNRPGPPSASAAQVLAAIMDALP